MQSSHSLAILAILDISRHLETCLRFTRMMQMSVLYDSLLPFCGLVGSLKAPIESNVWLRFRKWKVDFSQKKFHRKISKVKSRGYDATSLYQFLFWKKLLAVVSGLVAWNCKNHHCCRKLQKRVNLGYQGLSSEFGVCKVNCNKIVGHL